MVTSTTVAAPARRCDLHEEFLSLVYADDEIVREEFDALIADVWGGGHQLASASGAANAQSRPPSHVDPLLVARTRTALPADPVILGYSRQRSPP
jgi:hypothetical protein